MDQKDKLHQNRRKMERLAWELDLKKKQMSLAEQEEQLRIQEEEHELELRSMKLREREQLLRLELPKDRETSRQRTGEWVKANSKASNKSRRDSDVRSQPDEHDLRDRNAAQQKLPASITDSHKKNS